MDDLKLVSPFGAGPSNDPTRPDPSAAIRRLRLQVRNLHARHFVTSLIRSMVFGGLFFVGWTVVESTWGNALAITAAALLGHTLLFSIKGHWKIVHLHRARMYWLQDDLVEQDLSPVHIVSEMQSPARKAG
jgi:hypothetical protein